MWYNIAAAQGDKDAKLAQIASKFRDGLAKKMTPEQIAKAQEMTRNWMPELDLR